MRIAIGHGLLKVGLFIRRAATAFSAICTVTVVVVLISSLFGQSDFPAPFGEPGERAGAGTYAWQGTVLIVGLLVGGRILLAGLFAWVGWHVLPLDHRDFLVDLDDRMMGSLADDRSEPARVVLGPSGHSCRE